CLERCIAPVALILCFEHIPAERERIPVFINPPFHLNNVNKRIFRRDILRKSVLGSCAITVTNDYGLADWLAQGMKYTKPGSVFPVVGRHFTVEGEYDFSRWGSLNGNIPSDKRSVTGMAIRPIPDVKTAIAGVDNFIVNP